MGLRELFRGLLARVAPGIETTLPQQVARDGAHLPVAVSSARHESLLGPRILKAAQCHRRPAPDCWFVAERGRDHRVEPAQVADGAERRHCRLPTASVRMISRHRNERLDRLDGGELPENPAGGLDHERIRVLEEGTGAPRTDARRACSPRRRAADLGIRMGEQGIECRVVPAASERECSRPAGTAAASHDRPQLDDVGCAEDREGGHHADPPYRRSLAGLRCTTSIDTGEPTLARALGHPGLRAQPRANGLVGPLGSRLPLPRLERWTPLQPVHKPCRV